MDIETLKKNWFATNASFGKELGYPDCCIKAFCDQPPELLKQSRPTKDDILRYKMGCIGGKFTGFIPCTQHAKEIVAGKITLHSLIKNRSAKFPTFPNL